jgi:hypothetical protein
VVTAGLLKLKPFIRKAPAPGIDNGPLGLRLHRGPVYYAVFEGIRSAAKSKPLSKTIRLPSRMTTRSIRAFELRFQQLQVLLGGDVIVDRVEDLGAIRSAFWRVWRAAPASASSPRCPKSLQSAPR